MDIRRAIPVVKTDDPVAARAFYEGLLGFEPAMDQDGMIMYRSPSVETTQVILAWASPTASDPHVLQVDLSIEVEDVDAAFAEASRQGLDVVYPLTDEPWGIRRFFVRTPGGTVHNIAGHIGSAGAD